MLIGGSTEFQHRRTADSRASRALGISVDGDIAIVRPQAAAVDQRTFNHQSAAAAGLQHPRVGDGAATGIDHQRIDAAGKDQARVDQHHLPRSQLAGTRDGVVGIGEYRVGAAAENHVLRVVG
ncbi:hypothetical protein D3C72_1869390 [compost metagenome]